MQPTKSMQPIELSIKKSLMEKLSRPLMWAVCLGNFLWVSYIYFFAGKH